MSKMQLRVLTVLSMLWTLFTLALVGWWMVFSVGQLEKARAGQFSDPATYSQMERMIKYEGGSLLLLLILGGVGLVVTLGKLQTQHEKIRDFFSVFTHETKTSLARLILKTDLMSEEFPESKSFQQFKEETVFLENQLENALWVAKGFGRLFMEKSDWMKLVQDFEWSWPNLQWKFEGPSFSVKIDRRLFQMIVRNLVQNAITHGKATEIKFRGASEGDLWHLWVEDNGSGFQGDRGLLGGEMARLTPSSGSGIGLWVVRQGMKRMGGTVTYYATAKGGFGVQITVPMGVVG